MSEDYITITEGLFKGVAYRIRNAEYVEEGGNNFVKFDYDTKGLDEEKAEEFETMLKNKIIDHLRKYLDDIENKDNS